MVNELVSSAFWCIGAVGVWGLSVFVLCEALKYEGKIKDNRILKQKLETATHKQKPSDLSKEDKGSLVMVEGKVQTIDQLGWQRQVDSKTCSFVSKCTYNYSIFSNESGDRKRNYLFDFIPQSDNTQKNSSIVLMNHDSKIFRIERLFSEKLIRLPWIREIKILKIDWKNCSPALQIIKQQQKLKKTLSSNENRIVRLIKELRWIATMIGVKGHDATFLKGLKVIQRNVEAGLKYGSSLVVLGTVGWNSDDGLFIEPLCLFQNKESLLSDIQTRYQELISQKHALYVLSIGLFVIGAIGFTYEWKKNKKIKEQNYPNQ